MSAQVAADLRAAADVLERDGWTQGGYFRGRTCCQAGALIRILDRSARRSFEMSDDDLDRFNAAERAMDRWVSEDGTSGRAIECNDTPGRTANEVIAALRAAADAAEATP